MKKKLAYGGTVTLSSGDAAPTEFVIWPAGKIDTDKGQFLFDAKAASAVMEAYEKRGRRLTFDYEHKALEDMAPPGAGISAGSYQLEVRDGALWATDVRWTDRAKKEIEAKEWLFFSPAFDFDRKTGRIVDVLNIALTNIPATYNQTPLVAASIGVTKMPENQEEAKALIAQMLGEYMEAFGEPYKVEAAEEPAPPPEDEEDDTDEEGLAAQALAKTFAADKAQTEAEIKARVGELVKTGIVRPASKGDLVKLGMTNPKLFEQTLKILAPNGAKTVAVQTSRKFAPPKTSGVFVTPAEKKIIEKTGVDAAAFLESKKRLTERSKQRNAVATQTFEEDEE